MARELEHRAEDLKRELHRQPSDPENDHRMDEVKEQVQNMKREIETLRDEVAKLREQLEKVR